MTIELAELIVETRRELSDVPEDKISDLQVYDSLKDAKIYVDVVTEDGTTEAILRELYKRVGAFYSYINWTGIAERQTDTHPASSYVRAAFLREKALALLQVHAKWQLDRDLTLDEKFYDKQNACAGILSGSSLDEISYD